MLRTIKLGEADKIVTIATEGRGKVRAVAKGVRKTKSRFGARLEPLTHVALLLYEGRGDLDTITQAETVEAFRGVREDLDRLTQATALLEAVDHLVQEKEENPRLLHMLLGALRTLEAGPAPLVVPAFFWKLLAQEGFRPLLEECASCAPAHARRARAAEAHPRWRPRHRARRAGVVGRLRGRAPRHARARVARRAPHAEHAPPRPELTTMTTPARYDGLAAWYDEYAAPISAAYGSC